MTFWAVFTVYSFNSEFLHPYYIYLYSPSVLGLSNFNSKQIDEVWQIAEIKPAVLQCESHPYLVQNKLISHCKEKGITCKLSLFI